MPVQPPDPAELNCVAQRYGLAEAEKLITLHTSVAAAAWLALIDKRVAAIMQPWEF